MLISGVEMNVLWIVPLVADVRAADLYKCPANKSERKTRRKTPVIVVVLKRIEEAVVIIDQSIHNARIAVHRKITDLDHECVIR